MEFFQKLIRNSKDYFKDLKKDIKEFDFSIKSLKQLVIKRKMLICIILFSFLFLGISYGNYRFSKNILLNNLEIALKENKPRKIYKDMFIDEESVSKNDLKPLCSYYFQVFYHLNRTLFFQNLNLRLNLLFLFLIYIY